MTKELTRKEIENILVHYEGEPASKFAEALEVQDVRALCRLALRAQDQAEAGQAAAGPTIIKDFPGKAVENFRQRHNGMLPSEFVPSPLGEIADVLKEYDGIVAKFDPKDAEADFVMRGSDWREVREHLQYLARSAAAPSPSAQDQAEAGQWIPVGISWEGMLGRVLALTRDGRMSIEEDGHIRFLWRTRQPGKDCYFSHWMPLPPSPRATAEQNPAPQAEPDKAVLVNRAEYGPAAAGPNEVEETVSFRDLADELRDALVKTTRYRSLIARYDAARLLEAQQKEGK